MSKKFGGKKFSRRHTTVIDVAENIVAKAGKHPAVRKVVPGMIRTTRRGSCKVKSRQMLGGILLIASGNTSVQEIRVYTDRAHQVAKDLNVPLP